MTVLDDLALDVLENGPDLDVIARQIVQGKRKLKRPTPSEVDLAASLESIDITDTMKGSSTLTLRMLDPDFALLDSGFFDNDTDGRLDSIDVNYPDRSRFWWRVTQVSPSADMRIEIILMERAAVYLMGHHGPVKTSRAKRTRAEFLKGLADKVKAGGGIKFYSKELHEKQKPEDDKPEKKTDAARDENKDGGIAADATIKIKGAKATRDQKQQANRALDTSRSLDAPDLAELAMVCAAIGESGFKAIMNQAGSPYGGVFQGNVRGGVFEIDDTEGMATCFLKGGKGFQGGGAIKLANDHPDWGPGLIGVTVEGFRSNFGSDSAAEHFYGQHKAEALKIIEAYGGGGGGGTTYRAQFNFEVGSADEPNETYWDAMNRLAEDVKWALFLDGSRMYFDSEMTLIGQQPAAVIKRDDPSVIDWGGTWDARHVATEMTLDLICGPFDFRAGQVFQLEDFGPFSTGSTAKPKKLPGRWLISEIERSRSKLHSSFTLRQPDPPDREKKSELAQRTDAIDASTGATGDLFDECKKISDEGHSYPHPDVHHGAFSGFDKNTPLDCSESTALALHNAGYFDGGQAIVSGEFASSWGKPGRGQDWTVWANGGHVFIQSESGREWRFDTGGHPGVSGPRVVFAHRPTGGFTPKHAGDSKSSK